MDTYIKGNYKRSIFKNDNGYVIGLFKVKETNDEELEIYVNRTITFTGYFHELNEDDTYIMYGKLINHDKYGEQFQVDSYDRQLPEGKDAIVEFLSSGIFRGIGEKKAKKIVDAFNTDTLKTILEEPDKLTLIPTITKKQADSLHEELKEYESSYTTIVELNDLGFSTKDSLIIYNTYKEQTKTIINNDIYQLVEDIIEINFKKIDSIALKHSMKKDDTRRVKAGIIYVINEVCNTYGHTYLTYEEMFNYTIRCLNNPIGNNDFETALNQLEKDMKIIKEKEKYYYKDMYEAESNIVNRFCYLVKENKNIKENKKLNSFIKELEEYYSIKYNEDQINAIKETMKSNLLIITGGPGTGKTTIIKAITELYKSINKLTYNELITDIALLAPTGRASKRISESTQLPAVTIHRFLKWNKENNKFGVNEHNKSNVKFVIVDEASMIDTYLLDSLLKGLSYNTKIILVGDYNQLPSVGPGQTLKDLIESNTIPVMNLKRLYRQGKNSNIVTLAHNINENKIDNEIFNNSNDLFFIPCPSNQIKQHIIEICKKYIKYDYKKFQVLVPLYKTINGIDEINITLQTIFNPKSKSKKEILINGVVFREGDKVIQLTNMPDENVFNGDIGIIESIPNDKEISIDFDGNIVKYNANNFNKFKHGYAISIHKSQGSEFDIVIMPIIKEYKKMLYRKLVYTGITRSKKELYLIGDIEALEIAINNNNSDIRKTTLLNKLIEHMK